jgi:MSHA pilin protein MshD
MPARSAQAGLTLVELVVAMVVIALGVTAVLAMLGQGLRGSADPQLRIKTVELAQAYMAEIFDKRWDEETPAGGGGIPNDSCCGHEGSESRATFDDVDDYHGLREGQGCSPPAGNLKTGDGQDRSGRYDGYCVNVEVVMEAGPLVDVDAGDAKRVTLTITDPRGFDTTFTTYRLDF